MELTQSPEPGAQLRAFRGDVLALALEVSPWGNGAAFVRTNLGRAATGRAEVVSEVEERRPALGRDWHDVPMETVGPGRFLARLLLAETGVFEAKAFFLPAGRRDPVWPPGPNLRIKVGPAHTVAVNSIYTAFVRMFRPPGGGDPEAGPCEGLLDGLGYTVIPPSGTFRQLIRRLDHVLGTLRCRIVQLLPIHPVPTTYARMGRFGSPYAGLDFFDVDPALAEFDRKTTPLDQFRELVDAVHARGGRLFLDIPINHTGWASWLQIHRPHWFARDEGRRFASPGAWGVTWEDLSKLDYRHRDLWRYMAQVFLYWCRQGVDGFRCDAGYMVPVEVWRYLVARVRQEYPDTVFLLEGLGGPMASTDALLSEGGLDWAYSELFQNYDRAQIEAYLPGADALSTTRGLLVHYAETHDNNRLAATSEAFARLRTALTALLSREGAFGITCGVEWLATEKLDVHGASDLSWGSEPNLVAWIARLHAVHETHPAFLPGARISLVHRGPGNVLAA
ncbi:MAG: glycogen debranching protein, partial [Deltaproteobacteria bacterium]|nr:glycogen debranching protein [Deltaproteobacteria bacterium]